MTEDQLKEVSIHSGVLETPSDFLHPDFRTACEDLIPSPGEVEPKHCMVAVITKTRNHPQRPKTTQNDPQRPKTTHNEP